MIIENTIRLTEYVKVKFYLFVSINTPLIGKIPLILPYFIPNESSVNEKTRKMNN